MSRHDSSSMPPELRERLDEESPDDRAELEAVWARLGRLQPHADDVPDARDTWAALQERLDAPGEAASTEEARASEGQASASGTSPSDRDVPQPPSDRTDERAGRTDRQRARKPSRSAEPGSAGRDDARTGSATPAFRLAGPWGVAVAAVLLLAGAAWWWSQPVTVTAPTGDRVTATLPDGSTVELNSGTSLAYDRGFDAWPFVDASVRAVRLDGEAFFNVQDASRAFVVETFNARVEVLGTEFNVRARETSEAATEVTVATGRVRVSPAQRPDASVLLQQPGETSRVVRATERPTQPTTASVDRALVWRQNGFAASGLPLTAVVRELERRYDVTIRIDASVESAGDPISLYYPNPAGVETIVADLCTARGLEYRPTSRGFEIYDE